MGQAHKDTYLLWKVTKCAQNSDVPPNHRLCFLYTFIYRSPPRWGLTPIGKTVSYWHAKVWYSTQLFSPRFHCYNYTIVSYSPHTCCTQGSVPILCSTIPLFSHFSSMVPTTCQIGSLRALQLMPISPRNNSQQISHLKRMLTCLITCPFDNKSRLQYKNKNLLQYFLYR